MAALQRTITIMQPYFIPYAGYFRLLLAGDVFVIYDDVQFKKGGWIHRNRLSNANGEATYLTLPIQSMPLDSTILDMAFQANAQEIWQKKLRLFPDICRQQDQTGQLLNWLQNLPNSPVDYMIEGLKIVCHLLGLPFNVVRSSQLEIPPHLKGQDRVIHVTAMLGGTRYLNAPQGRALYDERAFDQHGIELAFLPDYKGNMMSILQRLLTEDPVMIRKEIEDNL